MPNRRVAVLCRHAPLGRHRSEEAIDAILTLAAMGLEVQVIYCDDGVYQWLPRDGQPIWRGLAEFAEYDIDEIVVEAESLAARGLTAADLVGDVTILPRAAVFESLRTADQVISL